MFLEENKPLAPFTTFGIGGPARWFVEAGNEADIVAAVEWAEARGIPLFILGGGSNLLVADEGFDGLVLHVALRGVEQEHLRPDRVAFHAAAGEDWDAFVQRAAEANCAGIECLAGIPGTVGGTPVQNVGAYGQEVASAITAVRAFDVSERRFVEIAADECGFAYRRSRFNSVDRGRFVVSRVDYQLQRGGSPTFRYADLQRAFPEGASPSLSEVAAEVRSIRRSKGMLLIDDDPDCRSAGSFFKNPVVPATVADRIAAVTGAAPPQYPAGKDVVGQALVKMPAAWLVEQAGFHKGYTVGRAGVSSRHTLALVNRGGATAHDILALADRIQSEVHNRFGITLDREPVLLAFQG